MKPTLILYIAIGAFFLPACATQTQAELIEATCMRVLESIERGDFETFRRLQGQGEKGAFDQFVTYYRQHHLHKSKLVLRKSHKDGELVQLHFLPGSDAGISNASLPTGIATPSTANVSRCDAALEQSGHHRDHPTRAGPSTLLA
ncbi:hypothetical protein MKQ68_18585 [Chitinophaga horti]|uniref:Uncharacterized protein n=1 Tax=Chitinophaga horti TaxID=2920382 RepID=A0ABY6IXX0_9BACT|nr:hypothetical protein [Chitinophaga horti]UYQ92098.1 hypothetical protein MKQ68_18585 [Chitinophaga horti]